MRGFASMAVAAFLLSSSMAAAQSLEAGCAALANESEYPSSIRWMAPIAVNPESGWILRGADIDPEIGFSDEGAQLMGQLRQALLHETGTKLAIVVPPQRGIFEPGVAQVDVLRDRHGLLVEQLVASGAIVPDILATIDGTSGASTSFYFKTDTHWTPKGALLVAEALAATIEETGILAPVPSEPIYLRDSADETLELKGGLLRAVEDICGEEYTPELQPVPIFVPTQNDDLEVALFGDTADEVEITLIGTSFSSSDRFRWQDAVAFALQREVRNRSVTGGAFDSAFVAYAEGDLRVDRPALLIWEFQPYYVKPYLGSRIRDIIGSVLPSCVDGTGTSTTTFDIEPGEASSGINLPADHDVVGLTIPGFDLGTVRMRIEAESGQTVNGLATRRDRVAAELRQDEWRFYTPVATDDGFVATGGEISFRIEGLEAPVVAELKSCQSAFSSN